MSQNWVNEFLKKENQKKKLKIFYTDHLMNIYSLLAKAQKKSKQFSWPEGYKGLSKFEVN